MTDPEALDAVGPPVAKKLVNMLADEAGMVARETLVQLGLSKLVTAEDRLQFGGVLIERGGVLTALGRAIQTQATLHGAIQDLDRVIARRRVDATKG